MRAYIIRRLLLAIPTLWLATLIVFFFIRLIPGDAIEMILSEQEITGTKMSIEAVRTELGLDLPIHIQYGRWMNGIMHGDFGVSLWGRTSVIEKILPRIPVSFTLGLLAIMVGLFISLPVGIFSAIRQDSVGDYLGRSAAIACIAIPGFWIGTLIMVFPSIWWNWSPEMLYVRFSEDPLANLGMVIIPATILGMVISGITMRMTRTMILEVLRQDYIRTAWAKGLKERVVLLRHVLKNALIPIVTIVGLQAPLLIGGSVIFEQMFNLPGVGRLLVFSLHRRDYPVLSAINIFVASFVLIINLVVDLTYAFLDPRIRYK